MASAWATANFPLASASKWPRSTRTNRRRRASCTRAGYQIHIAGNVSLGDFTNRLKFDGRVQFNRAHQWEEVNMKITSRQAVIEIHSLATNQTAHVKFSNDGTRLLERDFTFAELQNPATIVSALTGNWADGFWGAFDLPEILPGAAAQKIEWDARRTRVNIGTEAVPVYRLGIHRARPDRSPWT